MHILKKPDLSDPKMRVKLAKGGKRTAFTTAGIGKQLVLHICHRFTISAAVPACKAKLEHRRRCDLHCNVNRVVASKSSLNRVWIWNASLGNT